MSLLGSQSLNTKVLLFHFLRSSSSKVPQSKKRRKHLIGLSSFLQTDFQHVACRSIDNKYHDAPKTYENRRWIIAKSGNSTKGKALEAHISWQDSNVEQWKAKWRKEKFHTWLANIYNRRLYAAPAQAVFVTTPVALIIWELNGKIRYNLGTYWSKTISTRALLVWSAWELLIAGITNHMTICGGKKKGRKNQLRIWTSTQLYKLTVFNKIFKISELKFFQLID